VDQNGIIWFTESNATKLGRFDPASASFKEYTVPGVGDMWGIAIDRSGEIWLTQYSLKGSINPGGAIEPGGSGRLVRFDPRDANFSVVQIPTVGAFPFRVVADQQGRVWFTELLGNQIGSYDPNSGKLQEYSVPTPFAGPADLTFDHHGSLWFSEAYNQSIAKFNPQTGAFLEYHLYSIDPTQYVSSPVGIAIAPDGIVWVADHGGNWIVQFNSTSQQIVRYPTHEPPPQIYPISIPNDLLIDNRGRVWFAEHGGNSIGVFYTRTQEMVEYAIPTGPLSTALWIASAPNGDIWFTEWSDDKIGVVHTNLPIPFTLTTSQNHLSIEAGGQANVQLEGASLAGVSGYGTYAYSWTSYNPGDLNVTFSPPNAPLSDLSQSPSQVVVKISPSTPPGLYMLSLGIDAGGVRVWTMVQTDISVQPPIATLMLSGPWFPIALIAGLLALVAVLVVRINQSKRHKNVGR
jgi:virginiamycin B lyase